MKEKNFRLYIVKRDGGKNAGHIDVCCELKSAVASADSLNRALGDEYIVMVARCPEYDNIEDKLDQIVQLLKNRSKNE